MTCRRLSAPWLLLVIAACASPSSGSGSSTTPRGADANAGADAATGTTPAAGQPADDAAKPAADGGSRTRDAATRPAAADAAIADAAAPPYPLDAATHDAAAQRGPDAATSGTIRIATWNIQVFGPTKASKPEVMAQIVEVIRQYDVIAIQEIKDASGAAPQRLIEAVNAGGSRTYEMLLSPRTGLQDDDRTYQEQYAVLYDTALLEALPGDRLYDDSASDSFQREPYVAHLRAKAGFSFVIVGVHTQPDNAVAEIGALDDVVNWAKGAFSTEDDFVVLGDFNAGCRYASTAQLDALELRGDEYFWIVPDSSDSNVATGSACAYDRIVTTAAAREEYAGSWGVDEAFTDSAVSDHWPVWAEFGAGER